MGAASKRLTRVESRAKIRVAPADSLELLVEVEVDREVADPDMEYAQLVLELEVSEGQNSMQKMLMLQLKQTSDLVKTLLLKAQSDPLSAVLEDSDNAREDQAAIERSQRLCCQRALSSTDREGKECGGACPPECQSGARSCRVSTRTCIDETISRTTHSGGRLQDYGPDRVSCGMGLGAGDRRGSRCRPFVSGSCSMSSKVTWTVVALTYHGSPSEPNYQLMSVHKKKPCLNPFARLPPATWVAANVSYLKDVDTFESRLRNLGGSTRPAAAETEKEEKVPKRTKKWKGGKGMPQKTPMHE